jgi:hypothetical protein
MLIKNGFKKDCLVSFKLVNGEEIIARVEEDGDEEYVISKPISLVPSPQGMAVVPYMLTAELSQVPLKKMHVMMAAESSSEITSAYIQATTGITTINNSNILRK